MKFCYAYFWGAEAEKRKIEFARQMDVLGAVGGINPGTGFRGPIRPDHVPTMAGDSNDRPGYSTLGNLYATGYIRGLMEAVYKSY
jgi:D-mannonate dehydratase